MAEKGHPMNEGDDSDFSPASRFKFPNPRRMGVHVLSEHVFCPRAALIASESGDDAGDEEPNLGPRLDLFIDDNEHKFTEALHQAWGELRLWLTLMAPVVLVVLFVIYLYSPWAGLVLSLELGFVLAVAVLAAAFSLGSNIRIGGWQPWWSLTAVIPGLLQVRNVFRFAYFFQAAVVVLGFVGIWNLRIRSQRTIVRLRGAILPTIALLSVAMAAELYPRPIDTIRAPTNLQNTAWINCVRQHAPPGKSVLYLPYVQGWTVGEFDLTARMMYLSTWHGIPVANGYSGYFPASHFRLQKILGDRFPNEAALQELADSGVGMIVAVRGSFPPDVVSQNPAARDRLQLMLSDESGFDVYRLTSGVRGNQAAVAGDQ